MSGGTASWFNQVGVVSRHEWRALVYAPLTVLFQCGFLVSLSVCIFLIADFYGTDDASCRLLLLFLPWLSMIFVPALAMRAFSDGAGSNGIELLLTLPLPVSAIVFGKYLAGVVFLIVTLLLTLPFVATLYLLGNPDPGVIVAAYTAAGLLLAGYYAVALLAAAITRDVIAAFISGLIALFVLNLLSWDVLKRIHGASLAGQWRDILGYLSPKTWVDSLSRGVLDVAAVGYFLCLIAMALVSAMWVVGGYRQPRNPTLTYQTQARYGIALILGLACLAGVTHYLAKIPYAVDLTAQKEYTLDAGTRKILNAIPNDTHVTLHWSDSQAQIPTRIRTHARRVSDLFRTIVRAKGQGIAFNVIDPKPDTDVELDTLGAGISRVPMSSGDHFYLGASFHSGDKQATIAYFDPRREHMIEYDIAVTLQSLARELIPKVGILSPLLAPTTANEDRPGMSFMTELRKTYDLAVIPYFAGDLPESLDVLVLIQPVILQRSMLYAIDQFLMNGGRVIAMMDPHVRFDQAVNQSRFDPSSALDDLSDLLLSYGVKFIPGRVVGDANVAAQVGNGEGRTLNYPYWLRMPEGRLSNTHPVTASVNELLFAEAGELVIVDNSAHVGLITTGKQSGTVSFDQIQRHPPEQLAREFTAEESQRTIAVVSTGSLQSAFPQALDADQDYREESADGAQLFVVADTDWLFDAFAVQRMQAGEQVVLRPLNDNITLLLNMIEYASGDAALLSIRSRGQLQRPFTRVAKMFRDAEEQYREEETRLATELQELQQRFSDSQQEQTIAAVREREQKLLPVRQALRDTRARMRESAHQLGQGVTVFNLFAGPLLAVVLGWLIRRRRTTRAFVT